MPKFKEQIAIKTFLSLKTQNKSQEGQYNFQSKNQKIEKSSPEEYSLQNLSQEESTKGKPLKESFLDINTIHWVIKNWKFQEKNWK